MIKPFFLAAVDNVIQFGDTDIFPFPIENHVFHDKRDQVVSLLTDAFSDFEAVFNDNLPSHINILSPVGLTGFRWATQQDPFWNAFLLGVVLAIAGEIEAARIQTDRETIYSYRVASNLENGAVFRHDISWRDFITKSRSLAEASKFVVVCDISDCYQRIPHHRLENALRQIRGDGPIPKMIMQILSHYSNARSYSLPVGGAAARILVEAILNLSDQLMKANRFVFTRYADDYHIFVGSVNEAYDALLFLSEKLIRNEGLSLQKSKPRIMSSAEFVSSQSLLVLPEEEDVNSDIRHLFSLNLRYDPYSTTADADYARLKSELDQIDIIGILNRELAKTRIHGAVTKRAVQAIRHLSEATRESAVLTLIDNLDLLYPIFPVVAVTLKTCFSELSGATQMEVCEAISDRVISGSFVTSTELHASYAIRVLAELKTSENVDAIVSLHKRLPSPLVRREVILAMARWGEFAWLSDQMNDFQAMSAWERRAFIIGSYTMSDAGAHWRRRSKKHFGMLENLVLEWAEEKASIAG